MSKIIHDSKSNQHNIEKFVFKQYKKENSKKVDLSSIFNNKNNKESEEIKNPKEENNNKELFQRIEELSSQVVNLQMQREEDKKLHQQELIKVKDESYTQGVKDTKEANESEIEALKIQYLSATTKLQELEIQIKQRLSEIEEELIETSIIIAQKVIKKEIEENSNLVAKSIVKYLVSSIKDELDVRVLVNPIDYEEVLNQGLNKNIKVISDNSIQRGGVVILSPKKNIDGTISTRFKKTLQLIKES